MRKPNPPLTISIVLGITFVVLASPWYLSTNPFTDVLASPLVFTANLIGTGDNITRSDEVMVFVGGSLIWAAIILPIVSTLGRRLRPLGLVLQETRAETARLPTRGRAVALAWIVLTGLTLLSTFVLGGGQIWLPLFQGVLAALVLRNNRIALLVLAGVFIVSTLNAFLPMLYGYWVMDNHPIIDPIFYLLSAAVLISCWKDLPYSRESQQRASVQQRY